VTDAARVTLSWAAAPPRATLVPGAIHAFAFALDRPAPRVAALGRLLARDEVERADRFRLPRDRRRYVVGRALLRTILGRSLDRDPRELEFRYGAHGKPALQEGHHHDRVRFNMSRSHDLGVLAIQLDADLGVDVERIRTFPEALPIAERFFAPEEHAALRSLPAAQRDVAFWSYWTRKEAVVKSIGLGLAHPMDAFTLAGPAGAAAERVVVAAAAIALTRWLLPVPPPSTGYVAALSTAGSPHPVRCWSWDDPPGLQGR